MKKILFIFLLVQTSLLLGQFKGQAEKPINISGAILSDNPVSSLFSFFDTSKFSMDHSFSMSYSALGSNGLALGVYKNNIAYEFSDDLNMELETSFVNSPYSSFGKSFTDQINGVYLSRASLNYRPTEDMSISIQFRNSPMNSYYNSNRYGYGYSPFNSFLFDE
ncbi:MAG: hypothetical protein V3V16_07465 [Melioribacteraceae bacterium]